MISHLDSSFGNCITFPCLPSFSSKCKLHTRAQMHKRLRHVVICITLKCEREIGQSVPGVDAPRTSLLRLYVGFSSLCNSGLFGVAKMNNPLIIAMMKRPVSFVWLLHIKRDYRLIPHCESRKRFQVYFRPRSVTWKRNKMY